MCFSATASFVAGARLSVVGVATIRTAERPSELPFASIPLLFGIQQLVEGIIWLTFREEAPALKQSMTYVYSFFSHVLWPIYCMLLRLESPIRAAVWRAGAPLLCRDLPVLHPSACLRLVLLRRRAEPHHLPPFAVSTVGGLSAAGDASRDCRRPRLTAPVWQPAPVGKAVGSSHEYFWRPTNS